jgi:creatinine amidohydrolase
MMTLWEELATTDFARLDPARTVAVLPVAAVEQHGPHLPLGTDAILCDAILDRAAELVSAPKAVLRLPPSALG